ncbi:transcriptional regulator [Riemerella anatipestifer]|nr:transcriptional regulator [Riemerella anatipestifer]MDY3538265.1 transcriptional regulator [Riemerella anatipestifer]
MNYTDLVTKFWSINEKTPLGSSTIALYLFLLEQYRKSEGVDFSISDNSISQKLSLTRPTIITIKSKLRNIGLIQYKTKNGLPSVYRIVSDFSFLQEPIKQELSKQEPPKEDIPTTINEPSIKLPIRENIDVPTLEEFMSFAKTLEAYDESMDFSLKSKYESWLDAGWKNGIGAPIIKWQNNLKNTIPYLKTNKRKTLTPTNIPQIKRPKITYDE